MDRPVTVLVTNPLHPDGARMLADAKVNAIVAPDTSAETLNRLAADADGIIVRAPLPSDICDNGPRLRGIVRHGVGLDFIPVEAATKQGIAVANLPGCNTQAVAEYVFAQLLNMRRPLVAVDAALRAEGWDKARAMASGGPQRCRNKERVDDVFARAEGWERSHAVSNGFAELGGTTLGILGVGAVGQRVAAIASAFGMKVIGTSRTRVAIPESVEDVTLEELFERADAVVLSCALTHETRGIVNAARLALMKPDAVLINVSRGAVVDAAALADALQNGTIAGAALDVFEAQPLAPSSPLFDCPNLLLTPHIAAITTTSSRTMSVGAVGEMLRILAGEEPLNLVNPNYREYRTQP